MENKPFDFPKHCTPARCLVCNRRSRCPKCKGKCKQCFFSQFPCERKKDQ